MGQRGSTNATAAAAAAVPSPPPESPLGDTLDMSTVRAAGLPDPTTPVVSQPLVSLHQPTPGAAAAARAAAAGGSSAFAAAAASSVTSAASAENNNNNAQQQSDSANQYHAPGSAVLQAAEQAAKTSSDPVGSRDVAHSVGWMVNAPTANLDNVVLQSQPVPPPGPTQVRILVQFAALNPIDFKRPSLRGGPSGSSVGGGSNGSGAASAKSVAAAAAAASNGMTVVAPAGGGGSASSANRHALPAMPFPYSAGVDGSGIVEAIGSAAYVAAILPGGLAVGDRVHFHLDLSKPWGSLTQFTLAEATTIVKVPPALPMNVAAALPCASWTAYVALFDRLKVAPRGSIFINGAAGGVGGTAVQLAKLAGLTVFASCSSNNAPHVLSLGADVVIDYTREDIVSRLFSLTSGQGVDYVLETVSPALGRHHAQALRFGGALCQIAGVIDAVPEFFFTRQLSTHYVFLGGLHQSSLTRPLLAVIGSAVAEMAAARQLSVPIEAVPMFRARDALQALAKGHIRGKLVVKVDHPQAQAAAATAAGGTPARGNSVRF